MRISAVNRAQSASRPFSVASSPNFSSRTPRVISLSEFMSNPLSFTGRNKQQAIFIGAESDPWSKAGGVGVVMGDYRSMLKPCDEIEITPYYGGEKDENNEMQPLKDEDGDYVMKTSKGVKKLELIAEDTMQWGKIPNERIMLFRPKGDKNKASYFVFTDEMAAMKKPYDNNAFVYKSGAKAKTNGWNGDPYAKWCKASVKLFPKAVEDKNKDTGFSFNPATVICSDAQTAYVQEYMAQATVKGGENNPYEGMKPTYVGHNLGPGYCGETSMQNMFVNLGATPNQISKIESDPMYQQGLLGDKYFEPFVKDVLDETGTASAVMIPIHYTSKDTADGEGYAKAFTVVAEEYANNLATNPQAAHNIYNHVKQLYSDGTFGGILNPLNDPEVDSTLPLTKNPRYAEDCKDEDGKIYPKFDVYPPDPSYETMRRIKNGNKLKLLERMSASDNSIISGSEGKTVKINPEAPKDNPGPVVKPELIKLIKEGKGDEVPLFVSWGRIDTQKGHDITLDAFEKFAKTKEGKNAILILGAGLDGGEESKKVKEKMEKMLKDPDLQGRVIHIDGWAPAYAMVSAADAAIFSSRFEPCGLTDLEAMKYYCTPIVANTQGFKQKNFDPRDPNDGAKATSYKTTHEFNLTGEQIKPIIEAYVEGDEKALTRVQDEFPIFYHVSKDGVAEYDDKIFKDFADEYKKFIEDKKAWILAENQDTQVLPPGWDDWDELSKDYDFKYKGFARDLKDGIMSAEMADAISTFATSDEGTKEIIFNNLKNLKTGWRTNGNLHPNGESSYQAYKKLHMDPDYSEPKEEDLLLITDDEVISNKIEERQTKDMKARATSYVAGALTGLAGLLFTRTGSKEYAVNEDKVAQVTAQFEKKIANLTKLHKRNLAITAAVSAVGAAIVAWGLTKHSINKKAAKKDEEILVVPDADVKAAKLGTHQGLSGNLASPSTLSFEDFRAGRSS